MLDMARVFSTLSFRTRVGLPQRKQIALRIREHDEPTHPWNGRLWFHDPRAKTLGTGDGRIDGFDVDVVDPRALSVACRSRQHASVDAAGLRRHAFAAREDGRTADAPSAASRADAMAGRADRAHQCRARPLARTGAAVPVGARTVLARVAAILEDAEVALPDLLRHTVALVVDEIRGLDHRIATIDQQLAQVAAEHPVARRLQQIPGVGVLTATALVGAVGHIHAFRRGREFASWLGLTPREASTGNRRYLGRISKRGDVYLRCLLTHGARAVLLAAQRTSRTAPQRVTRLQHWAVTTAARRGHNKAAIAVANKLARIIWVVWHKELDFHSAVVTEAA